ncbi:hypothetical protein E2C01_092991 [Portunus trituberculatus]|uniref:Uncharacterized protein n=1 Tax=Portunus trituberculatus TaxID=210409 RepID=A0A5B7JWZ8_PORTR|nr:hypothetical protein [Portunus trituberculatus]
MMNIFPAALYLSADPLVFFALLITSFRLMSPGFREKRGYEPIIPLVTELGIDWRGGRYGVVGTGLHGWGRAASTTTTTITTRATA